MALSRIVAVIVGARAQRQDWTVLTPARVAGACGANWTRDSGVRDAAGRAVTRPLSRVGPER